MCDTLGSKGQHQNALQNHPQSNKAFHSEIHQGLFVLFLTMFALSVMCNLTIKKKSTHEVSVLMRAELSSKVLGHVECKKQWSSMEEFSVFLQRQGAAMLGCSKAMPLSLLRMKVDNTIVSLSCLDDYRRAVLDRPDKLRASIDSCEFVTDLCWDEGAYDELCASMLTKFQSFDYNVLNGRAVLDCTVVPRVDGAGFIMPHFAYRFDPTELVLRMNNAWLCHFAFDAWPKSFESVETLRIKGGKYRYILPWVDLNFQNLQELDVEEPYEATTFHFRLRPTLKRLRISKFGLTDVPLRIKDLPNLVELDLSDNDLQSLPAWIYQLSNLKSLILRNNPHLDLMAIKAKVSSKLVIVS